MTVTRLWWRAVCTMILYYDVCYKWRTCTIIYIVIYETLAVNNNNNNYRQPVVLRSRVLCRREGEAPRDRPSVDAQPFSDWMAFPPPNTTGWTWYITIIMLYFCTCAPTLWGFRVWVEGQSDDVDITMVIIIIIIYNIIIL